MRSNYWSNSKFADFIRGTAKIRCGTSEEWQEWEQNSKTSHPIRYWIAEEFLDKVQSTIYWPVDKLYSIKYYIVNRFVSKTHALTSHKNQIPRGEWRDVGYRFLPCLFNELVDFVEIEKAWMHVISSKEMREKYKAPWWSAGWFNVRSWRNAQAGIDYLLWEASLTNCEFLDPSDPEYNKPTPQAIAAQEILDLYKWWTEVYLKRPEPMEASGWSAYCAACRDEVGGGVLGMLSDARSPELREQGDRAHKLLHKIEEAYEKEDEEMLIRLIRVRNSLWT